MLLPPPRGPVSAGLLSALRRDAHAIAQTPASSSADPLAAEDLQLALWICYELHYRGFADAGSGWEWEPSLLALRARLEAEFLAGLRQAVPVAPAGCNAAIEPELWHMTSVDTGPSLSGYLQRHATRGQFQEFLIHRSIYHLKEADPHSWAIPRLGGAVKAALVEIQYDEYGAGSPARMHSELFRTAMRELGLDDNYGHYLPRVPGITLAITNLISFFGLHRRWRGALVGHLAAFEMTSSVPNRRYSRGFARLGATAAARRFFDEHVEADAVHEQLAVHDLCGALVRDEPHLSADVLFGAACCLHLDAQFARAVLGCWQRDRSSLYAGSTNAADALVLAPSVP
jgi:Iron-containing redox enzyme